jgi:hypothetical protein
MVAVLAIGSLLAALGLESKLDPQRALPFPQSFPEDVERVVRWLWEERAVWSGSRMSQKAFEKLVRRVGAELIEWQGRGFFTLRVGSWQIRSETWAETCLERGVAVWVDANDLDLDPDRGRFEARVIPRSREARLWSYETESSIRREVLRPPDPDAPPEGLRYRGSAMFSTDDTMSLPKDFEAFEIQVYGP